jgi:hypothetical protein
MKEKGDDEWVFEWDSNGIVILDDTRTVALLISFMGFHGTKTYCICLVVTGTLEFCAVTNLPKWLFYGI